MDNNKKTDTLGIISLVSSLIAGALFFIPFEFEPSGIISFVLSVVGLVTGICSRKDSKSWLGIVGIIISILVLSYILLIIIALIACISSFGSFIDDLGGCLIW